MAQLKKEKLRKRDEIGAGVCEALMNSYTRRLQDQQEELK